MNGRLDRPVLVDLRSLPPTYNGIELANVAFDRINEYRVDYTLETDAVVVRDDQAETLVETLALDPDEQGRRRVETLWGVDVWLAPTRSTRADRLARDAIEGRA